MFVVAKLFVPLLVKVVCREGSEQQGSLDIAAGTPRTSPGLVSNAGHWSYLFQIQLDFSFPHSDV